MRMDAPLFRSPACHLSVLCSHTVSPQHPAWDAHGDTLTQRLIAAAGTRESLLTPALAQRGMSQAVTASRSLSCLEGKGLQEGEASAAVVQVVKRLVPGCGTGMVAERQSSLGLPCVALWTWGPNMKPLQGHLRPRLHISHRGAPGLAISTDRWTCTLLTVPA